jgi:prepilin-type N-terminal cleavage/methylation domain-containing protein
MHKKGAGEAGFTLVELSVTVVLISIVTVSLFSLFVNLVNSAVTARRRAVALSLATNQAEYLKSLPYDSLVVIGGAIVGPATIPATTVKTVSNVPYTVKTSINYVDDAYDGCGNDYSNTPLKLKYCRNSIASTPTTDTNPADYKVVHVTVYDKAGNQLTYVDTQISARVSETATSTGALFITVLDGNGNPVSGATVGVVNSTVSPTVNASDTTDSNGISIIYGTPPDSSNDYVISASKSGYSSLTTIAPNGSLQPTYTNQKVLTQQASYVTLKIFPQGANSLVLETTDTAGAALPGVKVYVKGGYKQYTATTDTTYYYDNLAGSDTRPTTDGSGLAAISNLVPASYIFCGDDGSVSCTVGATKYYLAAAVPYGGSNALNPIIVPTYLASSPPATTYDYGGTGYLQKVRLMLTTNASFPRVYTLSPFYLSVAGGGLSSFTFTITGQKLPCSATAGSCSTSVKFVQSGTTYTASCTGATAGVQLSCSANLTGITTGMAQLTVSNSGGTLALPVSPLQGGLNVTP